LSLKRIEISGFKSFADKTVIDFSEGVTAIVGPNGCGKSNIADAFRWVLGEQSAKSLRGNKLDIIFAGTSQRKLLNYAEVSITLSNEDGKLPSDYSEITVTRKVYRNGDSEYLINKNQVRLKDVQNLFLDSGIGKTAFSIFEQGKIDQVIHYSPLERRAIFEEAAGILRFLQRKKEALAKLEQADLNLDRVKDIHVEVEKQMVTLEKQASKAIEFKEAKQELEWLEISLLVAKFDNSEKKIASLENKKKAHEKEVSMTQDAIVLAKKVQLEEKEKLASLEDQYQKIQQKVFQSQSSKEISIRENKISENQLKEIINQEKKCEIDLKNLEIQERTWKKELEDLHKKQKNFEEEICKLENSNKDQKAIVNSLDSSITQLRKEQQNYQQQLFRCTQEVSKYESELRQIGIRLDNVAEKRKSHIDKQSKITNLSEELSKDLTNQQTTLKSLSQTIDEKKIILKSLDDQLSEATTFIQEQQRLSQALTSSITEQKSRQKVLLKLKQELEGFSVGSKKIIQASKDSKNTLFEKVFPLYECIQSKKKGEQLLATALKNYTQTLVVQTKEHLEEVIEFAKKNGCKEYSLLCLDLLVKKTTVSSENSLKSYIKSKNCPHFFNDITIFHSLVEALNQKNCDFVTEDGFNCDSKGFLFFCEQSENNVFTREVELQELEEEIIKHEANRKTIEELLAKAIKNKTVQQNNRSELDREIRKIEMKLIESNFGVQRCQADLEKAKKDLELLKEEQISILKTENTYIEEKKQIEQLLEKAKKTKEEEQKKFSIFSKNLEENSSHLKLEQKKLQEKSGIYYRTLEESKKNQHAIHILKIKGEENSRLQERLKKEKMQMEEALVAIKIKKKNCDETIITIENELNQTKQELEAILEQIKFLKNSSEKVQKNLEIYYDKQRKEEQELNQTQQSISHILSQIAQFKEDLKERYHIKEEEFQEPKYRLEKSIEVTEKIVRQLRQKIDEAKDINMTSIEEYDSYRERHQFLKNQVEDLNNSKQEIVKVIAQLDTESRKIFKQTFFTIRENFQKNFKILFNGGEADLQFIESNDVLEAGIEIIAKPPGKQMRSIQLLSGGEKCLTAMALLFAIFEVKSSPFCLLDEIDAPLDDANVERFTQVVRQFIDRSQFIIITHNKKTMAIADMLFGVSMEEKGVSKLLSMQFSTNKKAKPILVGA